MRTIGWIITVLVLLAGCTQVDENPKFNPSAELPSWAYDAPFYYQPPQDLPALETAGDGIGVYYTRDQSFFVRHPGGCQLNGVPRVAVYYSLDMGKTWNKAGYFGVEQTHFNFLAKQEGNTGCASWGPARVWRSVLRARRTASTWWTARARPSCCRCCRRPGRMSIGASRTSTRWGKTSRSPGASATPTSTPAASGWASASRTFLTTLPGAPCLRRSPRPTASPWSCPPRPPSTAASASVWRPATSAATSAWP